MTTSQIGPCGPRRWRRGGSGARHQRIGVVFVILVEGAGAGRRDQHGEGQHESGQRLRLGPELTARPASAVKVMTTPMRSLKTPRMVRGWGSRMFLFGQSVDSIGVDSVAFSGRVDWTIGSGSDLLESGLVCQARFRQAPAPAARGSLWPNQLSNQTSDRYFQFTK
jgi:hypothetical protein